MDIKKVVSLLKNAKTDNERLAALLLVFVIILLGCKFDHLDSFAHLHLLQYFF